MFSFFESRETRALRERAEENKRLNSGGSKRRRARRAATYGPIRNVGPRTVINEADANSINRTMKGKRLWGSMRWDGTDNWDGGVSDRKRAVRKFNENQKKIAKHSKNRTFDRIWSW